jgi:hypothetical protein
MGKARYSEFRTLPIRQTEQARAAPQGRPPGKGKLDPFTDMFHALTEVCNLFSPEECCNYFKAAGYVSS